MYVPPIFREGFYLDDWATLAGFNDHSSHGWLSLFRLCVTGDSTVRPGACAYHVTMYWLFGAHTSMYHLVSAITLFVTALLLFVLLRSCRFSAWTAAATAALFIVFPGSDATRLWPEGNNLAWALLLYLAAVLVALAALQLQGRRAAVLHGLATMMFLLVLLTYDGMIPAVAMTGVFYYLARRDRAALGRGTADLLLAAGFGIWRAKFADISQAQQLTVTRSLGQLEAREAQVLGGAWNTVKTLFLPGGPAGIAVAAMGLIVIVTAVLIRPDVRRTIGGWIAVAAGSAAFAAVSVSAYVTAVAYYTPAPDSLVNRMNIVAAAAYCLGFVAVLAAFATAVEALTPRRFAQRRVVAISVAGILAAVVLVDQYDYSRGDQRSYALSWTAQTKALRGIRRAVAPLAGTPEAILAFGEPLNEQRGIPVFAASWDLRGAIDATTSINPYLASPFFPSWGCGVTGVIGWNGTVWEPYHQWWALYHHWLPIWFVDATTARAIHVTSAASCRMALRQMTPLPYFDPAGA
jgi:hypothetical protein